MNTLLATSGTVSHKMNSAEFYAPFLNNTFWKVLPYCDCLNLFENMFLFFVEEFIRSLLVATRCNIQLFKINLLSFLSFML